MRSNRIPLTLLFLLELEVLMRSHCQRIRAVTTLNGAQLLIPLTFPSPQQTRTGGTASQPIITKSLAIRYYSSTDIRRLSAVDNNNNDNDPRSTQVQALKRMAQSFAVSIVLLVLPQEVEEAHHDDNGEESLQTIEFNNRNSWTNRVMHLLTTPSSSVASSDSNNNNTTKPHGCCRVLVVPTVELALEGIRTFVAALHPQKEALKQQYLQRQELYYCIPPTDSGVAAAGTTTTTAHKERHQRHQQERQQHASDHVRHVMEQWSRRLDLPLGEENVLLELSGNLQNIASGKNQTAVPIEEETRKKMQAFFFGSLDRQDDDDEDCENHSMPLSTNMVPSTIPTTHTANTIVPPTTTTTSQLHRQELIPGAGIHPGLSELPQEPSYHSSENMLLGAGANMTTGSNNLLGGSTGHSHQEPSSYWTRMQNGPPPIMRHQGPAHAFGGSRTLMPSHYSLNPTTASQEGNHVASSTNSTHPRPMIHSRPHSFHPNSVATAMDSGMRMMYSNGTPHVVATPITTAPYNGMAGYGEERSAPQYLHPANAAATPYYYGPTTTTTTTPVATSASYQHHVRPLSHPHSSLQDPLPYRPNVRHHHQWM